MIRIPSKTFLLGEYAILHGSDALLLGHGPWFEADFSNRPHPFHPESSAGKFLAREEEANLSFTDPHRGAGGFGGSGAEFVAAFSTGKEIPSSPRERAAFAWAAWEASRPFETGSGADILTQGWGINFGADFLLNIDLQTRSLEPLHRGLGLTLSLFHTGKKLATHVHLKALASLPHEKMAEIVGEGVECLRSRAANRFAACVNEYRQTLSALGLEAPHTSQALADLPKQALAAKGCGAMGADVLAVLHEPGLDLSDWARKNFLAPVESLPL